ncbi:MAG: sigma 54-interacting transcriptional regulator [Methylococcaceae bacterium]|nr:sigma 54-interacting transcriptional regulator [Methylococcaceae bacterium]
MTKSVSFLENNRKWLAQFDSTELFFKMLDLCDANCFYIVDQDQKVRYWSRGMERLSGLDGEKVTGITCVPGCEITEDNNLRELDVKILAGADAIPVEKFVRILRDKSGLFVGGVGLLVTNSEQALDAIASKASVWSNQSFHGIISRSPAMRNVFQIIQNAAETEATVLVRGESGAGKELVARAIHNLSARQNAPFLAINCAALSSNLLESELFGHVRGAFTGAIKDHQGLFQRAHGGTLFLDEVAELPLELQAKLLRVIQERNYIPVGGDRSIAVDVRIVAATHRSLREEVKTGHFREDLMYRLRVVPIFIPPLHERREDISLLIWHFIHLHNAANLRKIEKIDPQAMRVLLDYRWPGNVRELHNIVEYAFAVGRGSTLRLSELPPEFRESSAVKIQIRQASPLSPAEEKLAICQALEQSKGAVTTAAQLMGMSRATFWRKRKSYGV